MSYSSILDMRELYRPGQELRARILEHKPAENQLKLSVREATPNPFDGAERRHPVGSRRQAVITGKYVLHPVRWNPLPLPVFQFPLRL